MISVLTTSLAHALMLPGRPVHSKAFSSFRRSVALCLFHALYEPFKAFPLLWSSIFVTRMANKISFQVMEQSVPDKVYGIHYSCADEHGCM